MCPAAGEPWALPVRPRVDAGPFTVLRVCEGPWYLPSLFTVPVEDPRRHGMDPARMKTGTPYVKEVREWARFGRAQWKCFTCGLAVPKDGACLFPRLHAD